MFRFLFRRRNNPEERPQKISYMPWPLQLAVVVFVAYVIFQDHSLRERMTPNPKEAMEELMKQEAQKQKALVTQSEAPPAEDATPAATGDVPPHATLTQTTIKRGEGLPPLCGDRLTVHLTATDEAGTIVKDTTAAEAPEVITLGETILNARLTEVLSSMRMGEIRQVYFEEPGASPLTIDLALIAVEHQIPAQYPFHVHTYSLTTGEGEPLRCGEQVTLTMRYFAPDNPGKIVHEVAMERQLDANVFPIVLLRPLLKHRRGETLISILPDAVFEASPLDVADFPTSPAHFVELQID